jgi:outer membrane protein assembly factor BamB
MLLLQLVAHSTLANDWTRFGGSNGGFQVEQALNLDGASAAPSVRWKRTIGEGLSSLVRKDDLLYVTHLRRQSEQESETPESERANREVITALNAATGKTVWEFEWEAGWIEDQQAFGGKSRAPQATPLIVDDRVIALGFTGKLFGLDRTNGKLTWKVDLVEQFSATPVQFGFSASPIVYDNRLILLAGGRDGGLVCLDLATGKVEWNVPCEEAGYATPVILTVDGTDQIVFVTRNNIVGVDAAEGEELWRYALPKPGMTNVPTPLQLGAGRLAVSGQGVGGTRELKVARDGDGWKVSEGWLSRVQFFFCNWLLRNGVILGCNDDLIIALNAETGETLGRWRGYANSNLLGTRDHLLVLDGEGALAVARSAFNGLKVLARYEVLKQRCWTPSTLVGNDLYCRGGDQIVCLELDSSESDNRLTPLKVRKRELVFRSTNTGEDPDAPSDPIGRIVGAFEAEGPQAAWKAYSKFREKYGQQFLLADRQELAKMAIEQGLADFGKQILDHAVIDFPKDEDASRMRSAMLSEQMPQPQKETEVADNGLEYIELAIKNNSKSVIQAYVKGPKDHPFSYGLPFAAGAVRVEKWPVGTRLYETQDDVQKRVLLTVKESDAGKTVPLRKDR